jgi:hypothetical protein
MEKAILESTKYISNLYFFVGSSFFIPLSISVSEWFSKSGYDLTVDLKVILRVLLAIIGVLIIRAGCCELVIEEERFKLNELKNNE